jgi:uncharacterized protein (DUF2062 family)
MIRGRFGRYLRRVRAEIHASLTEEYTPHRVASSFALGTFITMLPTLGAGLLVFVVLVYLSDWLNKIALFASAVVFNPVVKWGVYAASLTLGFTLLGPVEGITPSDRPGLGEGQAVVVRLLLGNTILALIVTGVAYVLAHRVASRYDPTDLSVVDDTVDRQFEHREGRPEEESSGGQ